MPDDPLNGIEGLPFRSQLAVLIAVVRTVRNGQAEIKDELRYFRYSIYGLAVTVIGALATVILTGQ